MDVIFLAYANSQQEPLISLKREDDRVYSTLVHKALGGHFLIHRDSYATIQSINEHLSNFTSNLAIFLYSGHAGSEMLLLDDQYAGSDGIASQLRKSARDGVLKLVILNGCATAGQVKKLMEAGVPAVIATNAKINDESATEFAIRFFKNITEKHLNIREAFSDSLGAAQLATSQKLGDADKPVRSIDFIFEEADEKPIWELFARSPADVELNPLPTRSYQRNSTYTPNEKLVDRLYNTLYRADAPMIVLLKETEEKLIQIDEWRKRQEIINCLPFPIAVHLQKLLSPVEEENEGYDKMNAQRLQQIGVLFHVTLELLTYIMIAQLWELSIKNQGLKLKPAMARQLKAFMEMLESERRFDDYIKTIREIRTFFDETKPDLKTDYFVDELDILRDFYYNSNFSEICHYLEDLRIEFRSAAIQREEMPALCETAEEKLCEFFDRLGFLHRYRLTSIQQIDILKFRHTVNAAFRHKMVKLMQIMEYNYYLMPEFMDNMGIILLKQQVKVVDPKKKIFEAEKLEWLNLSPFYIDKNAFDKKADLSNLMVFRHFTDELPRKYVFKKVTHPENTENQFIVGTQEEFELIRLQFESFMNMLETAITENTVNGTETIT